MSETDKVDAQGHTRRLPIFDPNASAETMDEMAREAERAANFLKSISHEGRMMTLCHLATGEKSVNELEELLSQRQASMSQHLARLRYEGLVIPRKEGKTVYYRLADDRATQILEVVYDLFCGKDT